MDASVLGTAGVSVSGGFGSSGGVPLTGGAGGGGAVSNFI